MKKILIAVDDTKSARVIFEKCMGLCKCMAPEEIALVYVEQFAGKSLLDDMILDSELETLKEVLEGTEYKEALDAKAEKVLNHYKAAVELNAAGASVKTIVRTGHPAEQILQTAQEEGSDIIFIGSMGKRPPRMMMGSVSREVANSAEVPVLVMR
ncbi:universal stress protein [Thermodesulfobacteriota bacterium]